MSDFRFSLKKTDTLRNQVYKDIKRAIIQGKLKPGTRLREIDLSEDMGISRGPIRESLLLLEKEGLVETQPHRETIVSTINDEEVAELLVPLRRLLESFAIKKILPQLSDEHIQHLEQILIQLSEACENDDLENVVLNDLEFHEYLISLTKEAHLISLWSSVSSRVAFHFTLSTLSLKNNPARKLDDLIMEHRTLLDLIKTKDWNLIEPELHKHIN